MPTKEEYDEYLRYLEHIESNIRFDKEINPDHISLITYMAIYKGEVKRYNKWTRKIKQVMDEVHYYYPDISIIKSIQLSYHFCGIK